MAELKDKIADATEDTALDPEDLIFVRNHATGVMNSSQVGNLPGVTVAEVPEDLTEYGAVPYGDGTDLVVDTEKFFHDPATGDVILGNAFKSQSGDAVVGGVESLASATGGFFGIPSYSGTPGTPGQSYTGKTLMYLDKNTTPHTLKYWNGSAWTAIN